MTPLKQRVHLALEAPEPHTPTVRLLRISLFVVIAINVVAAAIETIPALPEWFKNVLLLVEVVSVPIFAVEYTARVWSAPTDPRYAHPITGRLRYAVSPIALMDLAAILPAVLGTGTGLRFLRVARLARIGRMMKLTRYSRATQVLYGVVRQRRADIGAALSTVGLLVMLGAALAYYAERDAQPEVFSSIPKSLWWAVVTVTTVGYGDMYPITSLGRAVGGLVAILGIGAIALPTAILGAGFLSALDRKRGRTCPHCGAPIPD